MGSINSMYFLMVIDRVFITHVIPLRIEKESFHQELHSFEIITFDSRNVLVNLHFCNNNKTIHSNQIYEELQPLKSFFSIRPRERLDIRENLKHPN